jgi:hypothetical protein
VHKLLAALVTSRWIYNFCLFFTFLPYTSPEIFQFLNEQRIVCVCCVKSTKKEKRDEKNPITDCSYAINFHSMWAFQFSSWGTWWRRGREHVWLDMAKDTSGRKILIFFINFLWYFFWLARCWCAFYPESMKRRKEKQVKALFKINKHKFHSCRR